MGDLKLFELPQLLPAQSFCALVSPLFLPIANRFIQPLLQHFHQIYLIWLSHLTLTPYRFSIREEPHLAQSIFAHVSLLFFVRVNQPLHNLYTGSSTTSWTKVNYFCIFLIMILEKPCLFLLLRTKIQQSKIAVIKIQLSPESRSII